MVTDDWDARGKKASSLEILEGGRFIRIDTRDLSPFVRYHFLFDIFGGHEPIDHPLYGVFHSTPLSMLTMLCQNMKIKANLEFPRLQADLEYHRSRVRREHLYKRLIKEGATSALLRSMFSKSSRALETDRRRHGPGRPGRPEKLHRDLAYELDGRRQQLADEGIVDLAEVLVALADEFPGLSVNSIRKAIA